MSELTTLTVGPQRTTVFSIAAEPVATGCSLYCVGPGIRGGCRRVNTIR